MKEEKEFVAGAVMEIKKELLGDQRPGCHSRLDKEEAGKLLAAVKGLKSTIEVIPCSTQRCTIFHLLYVILRLFSRAFSLNKHVAWQDQENYIGEQNARIKELEAVVAKMRSEYISFVDMQKGIIESLGVPDPLDVRQGPREGPFCLPSYFVMVTL